MTADKDWDFDEIINRSGTGSMKWDPKILQAKFGKGRQDLLPLWVADMDFKCPSAVRSAMEDRAAHQVYGYTVHDPDYDDALISWYNRRHQWEIKRNWIFTSPGVVPTVNYFIQAFSKTGDKVLIQTPVYYPFAASITGNNRQVLENPLQIVNGRYEMDFSDLAAKAADPKVKTAILCSPHNPVGRVWTREELLLFGNICMDNNVMVLADEIHCDLVMPGYKHNCFARISEKFAQNSITANAASKTFNLAGLSQSNLIIPNEKIRYKLCSYFETLGMGTRGGGSLFGAIAAKAAYGGAETWLEDLILYLEGNYLYMKDRLETALGVKIFDLEGTYLPWIDFRPLGLSPEKIVRVMEEEAKIGLDHGDWFGENGAGFERINIACPRVILERAVEAIIKAFQPFLSKA